MITYPPIKSILDFTMVLVAMLLLWPVFLLIVVIIKLDTKGPVFFRQKRIGKDKKEFYIFKFRTMRIDTPKDLPTHMLQNPDVFITKSGRFLRKTSLDELPQIINILKGEMSIVGPRPALWNQYDLIKERDKYRANNLTPGLTGWAQVNGRDDLPIVLKAKLDGHYVNNVSFGLDVKILLFTILNIFTAKGITEGAQNKDSSGNG
jgi:O-antigen biosynthesis protein WbqP